MELTERECRKIFRSIMDPYMKQKGFKYKKIDNVDFYIKENSDYIIEIGFGYGRFNMSFGSFNILFTKVEDIFMKLRTAEETAEDILRDADKYRFPTIIDKAYIDEVYSNIYVRSTNYLKKEEIEECALLYIQYLETSGLPFVEKYSYLPNLLTSINEWFAQDVDLDKSILNFRGGGGHYFKTLIIARLCNDPLFDDKVETIKKIFLRKQQEFKDKDKYDYDKFVRAFDYINVYVDYLKNVEPIYNI